MKVKWVYLALCVLGTVLPYWQFAPWILQHGPNLQLLAQQLFANRVSAFFGMDVLVSAATLIIFLASEGRRAGARGRWAPLVALLTVGVSLALPLFLYMRESATERAAANAASV